jgi:hypothetical protein
MASCHKIDNNQNIFFSVKIMTFMMWKNWPLRKKNSTQKYPHKTGMAGPRHFVRNLVIKYFSTFSVNFTRRNFYFVDVKM